MNPNAREDYLTTEVLTAAPQKLHLMLIEGAIRQIIKTREHWQAKRDEEAGETLIRCQQIVTELMCGLRPEQDRALVSKVGAIYLFVYHSLVVAHLEHSDARLAEALAVLEVERETWRQVCRELGAKRDSGDSTSSSLGFVA